MNNKRPCLGSEFNITRELEWARDNINGGAIEVVQKALEKARQHWALSSDPNPLEPDLTPDEWRKCYINGSIKRRNLARGYIIDRRVEAVEEEMQKSEQYWEAACERCPNSDLMPPKPDLTTDEWRRCYEFGISEQLNLARGYIGDERVEAVLEAIEKACRYWKEACKRCPDSGLMSLKPDLTMDEWRQYYTILALEKIRDGRVEMVDPLHLEAVLQSYCCICHENILVEELEVRTLCNHVYHYHCLRPWATSHFTCPSCRRALLQRAKANNAGH